MEGPSPRGLGERQEMMAKPHPAPYHGESPRGAGAQSLQPRAPPRRPRAARPAERARPTVAPEPSCEHQRAAVVSPSEAAPIAPRCALRRRSWRGSRRTARRMPHLPSPRSTRTPPRGRARGPSRSHRPDTASACAHSRRRSTEARKRTSRSGTSRARSTHGGTREPRSLSLTSLPRRGSGRRRTSRARNTRGGTRPTRSRRPPTPHRTGTCTAVRS